VSFVREKEVSSLVMTPSCDPVSSLPLCFYQTDLAKDRVTCRGNTPDAWMQDRDSSVASGRTARGKAFQSVSSRTRDRARWSPVRISRFLLLLLVRTFVPKGAPVELVVDERLERRWGPHLTKCSYSHDPVRSSQKH
jgi:hypothetical protein